MLCLIQVLETHSVRNQNIVIQDDDMVNSEFQLIMSKYSHRDNLGDPCGMKTILYEGQTNCPKHVEFHAKINL